MKHRRGTGIKLAGKDREIIKVKDSWEEEGKVQTERIELLNNS